MSSPFQYAPAPESRSIVDIAPSYGLFIAGAVVAPRADRLLTVKASA